MPPKPPKSKKSQKKKVTEDVSPIVAGTSGTSGITAKGKGVEISENAPPLRSELSSGLEGIRLGSSSTLYKIWIKYGDSRPSKVVFDGGDVDDLIEAIKKKLSNQLGDVDVNQITLRRHGEEKDLRADLTVDESFVNTYDAPLQVIVNAPVTLKRKHEESEDLGKIVESAVEKALSRQNPAMIPVSNISETKINKIMNDLGIKAVELIDEDFQPLDPVTCQPFIWDMEGEEAQQMHNVEIWFKNSLNLPRGFHVKDIHTQVNYQRPLQGADVVLTGGSDISIGPSGTACVWIETKKTKEDFKEGQAIGELFLVDNIHVLNAMVVLTDCNNHWIIFCFLKNEDGVQCIVKSKIGDRGTALAIIRRFVLEEGNNLSTWTGKDVIYSVDELVPLQKRTKFLERIPKDDEARMADMVDDMSEQELFNMTARKRLRMLRNWCRLDEQPQVDQLIRQFSDDYENLPPMMFA